MQLIKIIASTGILLVIGALSACDAGQTPNESEIAIGPEMSYDPALAISGKADNPNSQFCGGIAGLQCPEGMECLIKESYPDASGTCVKPKKAKNWHGQCDLVKCPYVQCPEGMKFRIGPNNCCGTCVGHAKDLAQGQCNSPSDCTGLVHIMCVGSWSCEKNYCNYSCDTGSVGAL